MELKLFMLLLGSRAPGRNVEQHDFFFAIARTLKELVPAIRAFWPEAKGKIHIDGWREVTHVDGYQIRVAPREEGSPSPASSASKKLFFINLGGYQAGKLEEQHHALLTVKEDRAAAIREAKKTRFYKENGFRGAVSHVDDKYAVDVDDLYELEDLLSPREKELYRLVLTPGVALLEDFLHLGYFKLNSL